MLRRILAPAASRHTAAAVGSAAIALLVGACGNGTGADTSESGTTPPSAASPSSTPSAAPSPDYDTTFEVPQPGISPNATARFGLKGAVAGTRLALDTTRTYGFNTEFASLTRPAGDAAVLAIGDRMTPAVRRSWTSDVKAFGRTNGAENSQASRDVFSLTFYDPFQDATSNDKKMDLNREGPGFIDPAVDSIQTSVSTDDRLQVHLTASADMRLTVGAKPTLGAVTRDTTYYLVETTSGWKIDRFQGTLTFDYKNLRAEKEPRRSAA